MKKFIILLSAILIISLSFTGCSNNENEKSKATEDLKVSYQQQNNFSKDKSSKRLSAPKVLAIANTLMWTDVSDAIGYEIYRDEKLIDTVTDTHYIVNGIEKTTKFNIVAKSENTRLNSEKSSDMIIYKQIGFTDEETMTIELESTTYTIPSNISFVKISGNAYGACIVIEDRNTDITLELTDVQMTSMDGKSCITTSDGTYNLNSKKFSTTIIVNGLNILDGKNITSVKPKPSNNSGQKGYYGGDGGGGIALPAVSFVGGGSLILTGGDGGKGGDGANSTEIGVTTICIGGNGGDGGYGLACSYAVMAMDETGILQLSGGKGGQAGENGSIKVGAINSAILGSSNKTFADPGKDGAPIIGTLKEFGGKYIKYVFKHTTKNIIKEKKHGIS